MLVEGQWIDDHANLLICGPSGVGKSWLASALGNKACRDSARQALVSGQNQLQGTCFADPLSSAHQT